MQFEKAYADLLKGKKIRRREWEKFMHLNIVNGEVKTYKGEYTNFYDKANILISKGWMILDGDGKEMNFLEALEALKNNQKVTHKDWLEKNVDCFIYINSNQIVKCKAIEFDFMPTFQCMTSNDWEVLK